jgi:hypothetical protein
VILLFAFSLAFDRLLEFLFGCHCTHQGGDWGLVWFKDRRSGVMSDWRIGWRLERGEWIGAGKNSSQRTRPIP